ncbi:energy transducer TonB [Pelagicoccus sp. SDUM812002]|uniref:energy transducer TonB n=1 Tax=Pelagicoccus sp. SDUM812002 TaxID=3041266 RepID=UPI00280F5A91|nr:energy transducer TonB [Pelagicoccus sp. SDUM812002]MDQ8186521.1 energy transducer TonB [Pelagicoccus sp. SDUM812002]
MKTLKSCLLFSIALVTSIGVAAANDRSDATLKEIEITKQTDVRFPGTMRVIGVKEGHVSLVAAIGSEGELLDTLILESTRKAFTKSALKSLQEWEFSPASYDGTPLASSIQIDLSFQVDRKLAWQTFQAPGPADITRSGTEERPVTTAQFGELDAIPFPLEIVEPDISVDGTATIQFYIDELGHVRCPRIASATSLDFGETMLAAVTEWKFEPPIASGVRTNTMLRQTFSYADGELTAAEAN